MVIDSWKWKKKKCVGALLFTCWHVNWAASISKSSSDSLRSELLHWTKILEDNSDFHPVNLLNKRLSVFCLSDSLTVGKCHHQNPLRFSFSLCPFGAPPTLLSVFYSGSSPFIQHCSDSWVSVNVMFHFRETNNWASCSSWEKREVSVR